MDIATPRSRRKPAPGGFRVSVYYLPLIWRSCCSIIRLKMCPIRSRSFDFGHRIVEKHRGKVSYQVRISV